MINLYIYYIYIYTLRTGLTKEQVKSQYRRICDEVLIYNTGSRIRHVFLRFPYIILQSMFRFLFVYSIKGTVARDFRPSVFFIGFFSLTLLKFEYCIFSRRIRGHLRKGFRPWIRALGGVDWWKKPRVENFVQLSL
jgi:hypothetical protein